MNAPPFPANPAFGQYFGNWVWSGSRWVCTNTSGIRIVSQVFRASAPYTPSPGLVSLIVETIGGGGGSGAANLSGTLYVLGGGGGGSGGYSRIALAAGLVLGGVNVTIGAGGVGSLGSTSSQPAGGAGGATSFGALCVANGGNGGLSNNGSTVSGEPGAGASPGIGDVAFSGAPGEPGPMEAITAAFAYIAWGGLGGQLWGGAQPIGSANGNSEAGVPGAVNTGAGGTGAIINQVVAAVDGAVGGSGICIVTEYCWADTIDDGCGCGTTMSGARVEISASPQGRGAWGYEDGND